MISVEIPLHGYWMILALICLGFVSQMVAYWVPRVLCLGMIARREDGTTEPFTKCKKGGRK